MSDREERLETEKSICQSFAITFEGKDGKAVLSDLREYCGADKLCFDDDPRRTAFMLGARSVWLYIQERISMMAVKRIAMSLESGTDRTATVQTGNPKGQLP